MTSATHSGLSTWNGSVVFITLDLVTICAFVSADFVFFSSSVVSLFCLCVVVSSSPGRFVDGLVGSIMTFVAAQGYMGAL